jgi:hypothetical protein
VINFVPKKIGKKEKRIKNYHSKLTYNKRIMLFLLRIIIFSLLIILGSHYIYNQIVENVIQNNKSNQNRFEYHTFKYKKILNDIINATNRNFSGFSVACEGKSTFLAEASPEPNRMFSALRTDEKNEK